MPSALVTLNLGNKTVWQLSHPVFQAYAAKHGLDFVVIDQHKVHLRPRWFKPRLGWFLEKLQLKQLLEKYQRILYLDGDMLIHPNAPAPDAIAPADHLGVVREDMGPLAWKRVEEIAYAEKALGTLPQPPCEGYFNAGFMLISPIHRELFNIPPKSLSACRWPDQTLFNYRRRSLNLKTQWLEPSFNCLPEFGDAFYQPQKRREAFFVHYAGKEGKPYWHEDLEYFNRAWGLLK